MNKKRLLKLADYLETIPSKRLDMRIWRIEEYCGTVACALGHACDIPSFKRYGLKLDKRYGNPAYRKGKVTYRGVEAGAVFFGIPYDDAAYLFDTAEGHKTPKQVARNFRAYVANPDKTALKLKRMWLNG